MAVSSGVAVQPISYYDRLDQRRRYLHERVKAKKIVGWDFAYDEAEEAALTWALNALAGKPNG